MQLPVRTAIALSLVAALGCGGGGGATGPAPIESISVTLGQSSIVIGDHTSASATARDASSNVLSGRAMTWSSSNSGVATVDGTGVVTAVAAGTAGITASSEGKSGTANLTVVVPPVASITVSLASSTVPTGGTTQATATLTDAGGAVLTGRTVAWVSSNAAVATVSNTGLVTAVAAGSASIFASSEGKSGSATVTVTAVAVAVASVTVSLASPTIAVSSVTQATVTAKDADGNILSRPRTWSSDNASVATVNARGVVSAVSLGTANIIATSEGKSGSAAITIAVPAGYGSSAEKIRIVDVGTTFAPTLSGPSAAATTFVSRAPSVATVNAQGTITGVGEGQVWVAATAPGFAPDSVYVIVPRTTTGPVLRSDLTNFNVQAGATIVVNIILDTRSTPIGGAELSVGFTTSPTVFSGVNAAPTGSPPPVITSLGSVIRLSLASGNALSGQLAILRFTFTAPVTSGVEVIPNRSGFLTLTLIDLVGPTGTDLLPVSTSTRIPVIITQ